MFFEAEKRVSRSRAAVERSEKQESAGDRNPPPGRYYVPVPKTRSGEPLPTFRDWVEQQNRKRNG